jgi:hypothetical protein
MEGIRLPNGTRVLVVDSVGKPVALSPQLRKALRESDLECGILTLDGPLEVGSAVKVVLPPDPPDLQELAVKVRSFLEPPPEPERKPVLPPRPRRSKRERRGAWKK